MIDIVMLARGRSRLTEQAITSLFANTAGPFTLCVVSDGDTTEDYERLDGAIRGPSGLWPGNVTLEWYKESKGTGAARNHGVSAYQEDRGDYLYFSDNDAYFTKDWDAILCEAFAYARAFGFRLLGGYCHPFNQTERRIRVANLERELHVKSALGHLSCLMTWDTWDKYGPLEITPVGRVNASEDFVFSQKIIKDGWKVGSIWPWVVYNCGRTDTFGNKSPGDDTLYTVPQGVLVE